MTLGKVLFALLLIAPIAKADGFNPADVTPGEIVYDFTLESPGVRWAIAVFDVFPEGADFYGSCRGPMFPATGTAWPYCSTDNPIGPDFEAAGSTFNIAVDIFGFDPGVFDWSTVTPPSLFEATTNTATITTPEPSSLYLVGIVALVLALKKLL